jgi:hypothetical protein
MESAILSGGQIATGHGIDGGFHREIARADVA